MYPKKPVVIALRPITVLRLSRNSRQSHKGNEVFFEENLSEKDLHRPYGRLAAARQSVDRTTNPEAFQTRNETAEPRG